MGEDGGDDLIFSKDSITLEDTGTLRICGDTIIILILEEGGGGGVQGVQHPQRLPLILRWQDPLRWQLCHEPRLDLPSDGCGHQTDL